MDMTAFEAGVLHQRLVRTPQPSRMTYAEFTDLIIRLENEVRRQDPAPTGCSITCDWCNRYPTIAHRPPNVAIPV